MSKLEALFGHLPTWTRLRTIGRSPLVKLTAIAPILGAFILVNDEISALVHATVLDGLQGSQRPAPLLGFIPIPRLHMTYLGLSMLGVGSIIFTWRCPDVVRRYESPQQWLDSEGRFLIGSRIARELNAVLEEYWEGTAPSHDGGSTDWSDEPRHPKASYGQDRYDQIHSFLTDLFEAADTDWGADDYPDQPDRSIIIPEGVEVDCTATIEPSDDEFLNRFRSGILGTPNTDAVAHIMWRRTMAERGLWMNFQRAAEQQFSEQVVFMRFQDYAQEQPLVRAAVSLMYALGAVALAVPTIHSFVAILSSALR